MNTRKRPMIIGFVCQKGGVGKSTLAMLFANYLSYIKGKKIAVVDTDSLQNTIYVTRSKDYKLLSNDEAVKKEFRKQPFPILYPVSKCPIGDLMYHIRTTIIGLEDDYDYIIVDTKGAINEEFAEAMTSFRFCFIPTELSDSSTKSASNTGLILERLLELAHDSIEHRQYRFIWSRCVNTKNAEDEIEEFLESYFGVKGLNTKFLEHKAYNNDLMSNWTIFNSILFPSKDTLNKELPELLPLLEEMYTLVSTENEIYRLEED